MAVTQYKEPWGHIERPWGYEIRCDFIDDGGRIYNETYIFESKPEAKELDASIESSIKRLEVAALVPVELPTEEPGDNSKALLDDICMDLIALKTSVAAVSKTEAEKIDAILAKAGVK